MSVRAKFKVTRLELSKNGSELMTTVVMNPVYGKVDDPEDENGKFYRYTPGGEIKLATVNENASSYFTIGNLYYIDFTIAE